QGDKLPPGALMRLGTVRFHHPESIHSVAFAPDNDELLVFAEHFRISALRLWNVADGKELAAFDLKANEFSKVWYTRGVCFTPDGKGIVARRENIVEVVDRKSGKILQVLKSECDFRAMALSPDGKVLALASLKPDKFDIESLRKKVKTTICF